MPGRAHRPAMWTAAALGAAIAGLWLASGWRSYLWERSAGASRWVIFGFTEGQAYAGWGQGPAAVWTPWYGRRSSKPNQPARWNWGYDFLVGGHPVTGTVNALWLPLWPACLFAAAAAFILWRRSRRPAPGHCPCGYNLAGIAPGVCPECGHKNMIGPPQ